MAFYNTYLSGGMMRKLSHIIVTAVLVALLLTTSSIAGEKKIANSNLDYNKVEQTLLEGLASENLGLKVSSAYMLGEIKSENAVIPLTKILREGEDERARLAAALSLIKIGTNRSVYVVKQGERFNDLAKVRAMCEHLYNTHVATTFKGQKPDAQTLYSYLSGNQ
jgi:HEAT repeat protein